MHSPVVRVICPFSHQSTSLSITGALSGARGPPSTKPRLTSATTANTHKSILLLLPNLVHRDLPPKVDLRTCKVDRRNSPSGSTAARARKNAPGDPPTRAMPYQRSFVSRSKAFPKSGLESLQRRAHRESRDGAGLHGLQQLPSSPRGGRGRCRRVEWEDWPGEAPSHLSRTEVRREWLAWASSASIAGHRLVCY